MQIILPNDSRELWLNGDLHAFAWRFFNHFGWFPDRDESSINADGKIWYIETTKDISQELYEAVYKYCEEPEVFQMPTGEILQIDLDWKDMLVKLENYSKSDNTLDIQYIGHGRKQFIHFSRSLTAEEKTALKKLISNYINFL